jgi:isoleucyl-tRNA synthetase
MMEQLVVMMAPIAPHMAEELWQNLPYKTAATPLSVFQQGWVSEAARCPEFEAEKWAKLRELRDDVNKCIEVGRTAKEFGASMECQVVLAAEDPELSALLSAMKGDASILAKPASTNGVDDLRFLLMTSQVSVVGSAAEVLESCPDFRVASADSASGLTVGVKRAAGKKCDRCWYYSDSVGHDHEHSELCLRCADVVRTDGHVLLETVE